MEWAKVAQGRRQTPEKALSPKSPPPWYPANDSRMPELGVAPLSPSYRAPFLRPSQLNKHYSPQAAAGGGRAESQPALDAPLTPDRELGGPQLHFSKAYGRSQASRNFSIPTSLSLKPLTGSPQHTPEQREESSPPRPDPAGPAAPSWSVPKAPGLPGSLPGR